MNPESKLARIDLHCHSGIGSSHLMVYAAPGCESHAGACARSPCSGMNFVTITDHNTISGVRRSSITRMSLPEMRLPPIFPNNVKVHVVCPEINQKQFDEIQEIR